MHPPTEPTIESTTTASIATAPQPHPPKSEDSSRLSGSEFKSNLSGGLISSSSLSIVGGGSMTQIPSHASIAANQNANESPTPTQHQRRLTINVPPSLSQTARGW